VVEPTRIIKEGCEIVFTIAGMLCITKLELSVLVLLPRWYESIEKQ